MERGQLRLAGYRHLSFLNGKALLDRMNGTKRLWTSKSVGCAGQSTDGWCAVPRPGRCGRGVPGLVKIACRALARLLEQADIQSRFDFVGRTMTLARRPLLKPTDDAVPLVDLRPLGAR